MTPTRTTLAGVVAALAAIAIAAPVSTAGAATVSQQTAVITGPATFVNLNDQVSPGNSSLAGQVAT
jgi:hypothetical protein